MNKNIKLAKKHGSKIVAFKNLPKQHQMAIAWYMCVDGEAWEVMGKLDEDFECFRPAEYNNKKKWEKWQKNLKRLLELSLPDYVKKYGNSKFGVAHIPTGVMKKEMFKDRDIKEHETFEKWYKWYVKNNHVPKHTSKNRWPCILSCFTDELLEDGWHRFSRYVQDGHKNIPCVYYA